MTFNNASVTNVNEGEVPNTIASISIKNGSTDVSGNYNVQQTIGKLKIEPRPVTLTAQGHSWPYDGDEHTWPQYDITSGSLVTGHTLAVTVTGAITDVGTTSNTITDYHFTNGDIANYTIGTSVDGVLSITKRALTLTSGTDSKMYDGTALTKDEVTVTSGSFVEGQGYTKNVTGSRIDQGTSANTFTYTLNEGTLADNYDITSVEGTLTVTPKNDVEVTITEHSNTVTYNGNQQSVTGYDFPSLPTATAGSMTARHTATTATR